LSSRPARSFLKRRGTDNELRDVPRTPRVRTLALAVLASMSPSLAQAVDLCATTGEVTMPDAASVPIWGYVLGGL